MCVIIDTNKLSAFFDASDEASATLLKWVINGGSIVYATSGRYAEEIERTNSMPRLIELSRHARLYAVPPDDLDDCVAELEKAGKCRSGDLHILALALASGARIFYTDDEDLRKDIRNPAILHERRGHVYSNKSHRHLLTKKNCRFNMRQRKKSAGASIVL